MWPYVYLADNGEPKGFNVDLVTKIMRRLRIPLKIRLRSLERAREDLQSDSADLSLGVVADYNAPFGRFGKVTVCSNRYSMLVPRADSVDFITLQQLRNRKLVVRRNCHPWHYLRQQGFPDSIFTIVSNMETEMLREVTNGTGGAVWNKVMMEWFINKYNIGDRFVAVPVSVETGDYRFMSGDTVLLARVDSVCLLMQKEGEIDRLKDKWRTPGRAESYDVRITPFAVTFLCLVIGVLAYHGIRRYRHRHYYLGNTLETLCSQMALVLDSNKMNVWVYFPTTRRYAWMTANGLVEEEYSSFEFSRFYPDNDFNIIHARVIKLLSNESTTVMETVRCYSVDNREKVIDVEVSIKELRDEYGKTHLVCGVQHDITDNKSVGDRLMMLRERYNTALLMSPGVMMRFDKDGNLIGLNDVGYMKLGIDNPEAFLAEGYTVHDVDLLEEIDIANCPHDLRFCAKVEGRDIRIVRYANSKYYNPLPNAMTGYLRESDIGRDKKAIASVGFYYVHFIKNFDRKGNVINYMVFIYDQTTAVQAQRQLKANSRRAKDMQKERQLLRRNRNYALAVSDIWILRYHPYKKELLIYSRGETKHLPRLSQLQLLKLTDSSHIIRVFKVFHKLDRLYRSEINAVVKTRLRDGNGDHRHFLFHLRPVYDSNGNIANYFGTCRDITVPLRAQFKLEEETKKVREAEMLQSEFLKNSSFSMLQPLFNILQNIRLLEKGAADNVRINSIKGITSNIERLIMISDDTLLLSRIEAGLQPVNKEPLDFVPLFRDTANSVIADYHVPTVTYKVEEAYDCLPLYGDIKMITRILHEIVALSARYTQVGTLTVRYMYLRETLSLVVEDTGHGIPPAVFNRLYEPHMGEAYAVEEQRQNVSGLEMPICKALVKLLGGGMDIDSTPGRGISIYVRLPIKKQMNNQETGNEEESLKTS